MEEHRVSLAGNHVNWLSTGVRLRAGQTAAISASGIISFGVGGSWPFSPSGQPEREAGPNTPAPGLTANSLIARAGGDPMYIGASGQITAEGDAMLEVAANDDYDTDNGGHWDIVIRI